MIQFVNSCPLRVIEIVMLTWKNYLSLVYSASEEKDVLQFHYGFIFLLT